MFDKYDIVAVPGFENATVVEDQDGESNQVRVQFDNGVKVWVFADILTLVGCAA